MQAKYRECKEKWSFCIPGFQVYDLASDSESEQLHKYDKEYGKKLKPEEVVRGNLKNNIYFC